ncbi:protein DpdD [Spirillospora sp. CA-294931]|uniref:protein DpdD n=1 Tax=Spirillospora sp. CA-294931 TaxID=3240042 RepID=UPI003D90CBEB
MTGQNTPQATPDDESVRVEVLLERFFGAGNDAAEWGEAIRPFVDTLRSSADAPIVLPRFHADTRDFAMYVITRSPTELAQARELVRAFVGPTYSTGGDTIPEALDSDDPIDAAVIDFAGPQSTLVIRTSSHQPYRPKLRAALQLMQSTAASRPARSWTVIRPLGRLLAEFDAALSAGGVASSNSALEQVIARGGISATNLAHLRIKRFDRLGLGHDLLALNGLAEVMRQDPPRPVTEAVLNAVHSTALREPLSQGDIPGACDRLREINLPLPIKADVGFYSDEAVTVMLTTAVGRGDPSQLARLVAALRQDDRQGSVPDIVWHKATALVQSQSPHSPVPQETEPGATPAIPAPESTPDLGEPSQPDSWGELFKSLAVPGPGHRAALDALRHEVWRDWPPLPDSDEELSHALAAFDDTAWNRAWAAVGAIIEAIGSADTAPGTVREFITYALTFNKFSAADLVTLQALTEIFLRARPVADAYRSLLEELRDSCPQWVSPENADPALDLADRLVLAACPDNNARLSLAVALLTPLHRYQGRLDDSILPFVRQLSDELDLPLDWPQEEPAEEDDGFGDLSGRSLLLYSLDEAVLDRASRALQQQAPDLKIALSSDKVGHPALREKARRADVITLATRCATHAATGFITTHAKTAEITYADGSGSASLLRAATNGLKALQQPV